MKAFYLDEFIIPGTRTMEGFMFNERKSNAMLNDLKRLGVRRPELYAQFSQGGNG